MLELELQLDNKAQESLNELMNYYKVGSRAEIVTKALVMLKIAAHVEQTNGQLLARKGNRETEIVMR